MYIQGYHTSNINHFTYPDVKHWMKYRYTDLQTVIFLAEQWILTGYDTSVREAEKPNESPQHCLQRLFFGKQQSTDGKDLLWAEQLRSGGLRLSTDLLLCILNPSLNIITTELLDREQRNRKNQRRSGYKL